MNLPFSPITPRRISGSLVDVAKRFGGKPAQGQHPWHRFPQHWLSPELQAAVDIQGNTVSSRGCQPAPGSLGRLLLCAVGDSRGHILCSWQAVEGVRDGLLTACPPHSSFLSTLRPVQFENGKPLFYLKLGAHGRYPPERKRPLQTQQLVPSLITVWQKPKYEGHLRAPTPSACMRTCADTIPAALYIRQVT